MSVEELRKLVKQSLSIVSTATAKDDEIDMWINAAITDLKRQAIAVRDNSDPLVKSAIVMFVKANFGNVDVNGKELSQQTYNLLCSNLSLSSDYQEDGVQE